MVKWLYQVCWVRYGLSRVFKVENNFLLSVVFCHCNWNFVIVLRFFAALTLDDMDNRDWEVFKSEGLFYSILF